MPYEPLGPRGFDSRKAQIASGRHSTYRKVQTMSDTITITFQHVPFDCLEDAGISPDWIGVDIQGSRHLPQIEVPYMGDEKTVTHKVYAYIHSGIALSLEPFTCQWDSASCGTIELPQSVKAEDVLAVLNAYINNNNYYAEVNDHWIEGTMAYCEKEAESLGLECTFEY